MRHVMRLRWDGLCICQELLREVDHLDVVKQISVCLDRRRRIGLGPRTRSSEVGRLLRLWYCSSCLGMTGRGSIPINTGTFPSSPVDVLFCGTCCDLVFDRCGSVIGCIPSRR
jgi:hypothetical protein